jgi:hypothetical protein
LANFRDHVTDNALLSQIRPRAYANAIVRDHRATFAAGDRVRHVVELDIDGFNYHFHRLTLPLAAGGRLPPMLMVMVRFDVARSQEFWRRYVEARDDWN